MKTVPKVVLLFLSLFLLITSCTVSKEVVGDFNPEKRSVVYKKSHDFYFFWEMVKTRSAEDYVTIKDYQKVTKRTPFDVVLYYGTLGIFSPYTVIFYVEKETRQNSVEVKQ